MESSGDQDANNSCYGNGMNNKLIYIRHALLSLRCWSVGTRFEYREFEYCGRLISVGAKNVFNGVRKIKSDYRVIIICNIENIMHRKGNN